MPTCAGRSVGLDPGELREMIQGYHRARGWDDTGFVPACQVTA